MTPAVVAPSPAPLAHYDAARIALETATRVDDVKEIHDQAAALQAYHRQRHDPDLERWVAEIKLRAMVRIGELSRELEKTPGPGRGKKRFPSAGKSFSGKGDVLRTAGISTSEAQRAEQLATPEAKAAVESYITEQSAKRHPITMDGALVSVQRLEREQKRQTHRQVNAERIDKVTSLDELDEPFPCIVADPPWSLDDEGDVNQFGRAKQDYQSLRIEDLLKMSATVMRLAETNSHIYLWITNRSLPKGFGLLEAWGFRHITMLTWPKESFGIGNYFRGQTEHVLFGVRGSLSLLRKNAATLLPSWKRGTGGHSSKPIEFYNFVESCSQGPYLELFSRSEPRSGWTMWGEDGIVATKAAG